MESLPFILLALACPIGMGLMMLLMGKGMTGMGGSKGDIAADIPESMPSDPDKRMAVLQAQRQLLDAQIAAAEERNRGRNGTCYETENGRITLVDERVFPQRSADRHRDMAAEANARIEHVGVTRRQVVAIAR